MTITACSLPYSCHGKATCSLNLRISHGKSFLNLTTCLLACNALSIIWHYYIDLRKMHESTHSNEENETLQTTPMMAIMIFTAIRTIQTMAMTVMRTVIGKMTGFKHMM